MAGRNDIDALIRLRVACDMAVEAAHELGNPLPAPLGRQIDELCAAIQTEIEARDAHFAEQPAS